MRAGAPSKATIAEDVSACATVSRRSVDEPIPVAIPIAHVDFEFPLRAIRFPGLVPSAHRIYRVRSNFSSAGRRPVAGISAREKASVFTLEVDKPDQHTPEMSNMTHPTPGTLQRE